ncbi:valine--pyruvate transaminase [Tichowtungia aerotolerans]|uniref:Valine--pyruvate transaminase n=1 Tax=Tichowtungia aerotolerans TaxID=2697043 RepID=A0A6P1MI08_9BACT|nr:valine--pyruvate transaminase [Tichowtungia aerotolerans]QHI70685.1 valine--pyruvate transaminase [Tichowtungia aerotolerans]
MKLSKFGQKFTRGAGITQLMDDLGAAMAGGDMLMLGGGNPAHIPEVQKIFRERMESILAESGAFESMIGNYDGSRGNAAFVDALAEMLRESFGWDIGPENIALTNGSQSAFFSLFNLFAGEMPDGSKKKILFPLTPEYIGYADAGLSDDFFAAKRPSIELLGDRLFKYHVNFQTLEIGDEIGAICVSRPTNPTGNMLTDDELRHLDMLARERDIPLIIDNAYGTPFPNIIYTEAQPLWNENTVVCMSLSKFGLPNLRTGIVVARKEIAAAIGDINGIMCLAPGGLGARFAMDLVRSKEIMRVSRDLIGPFYQRKAQQVLEWFCEEIPESVPFRIHKPEGAIFLWLWFEGLPGGSAALYERLKARNTLVIPGHHFFPGLENDDWAHKNECIRVTYAQDDAVVRQGVQVIAEEVGRLYG